MVLASLPWTRRMADGVGKKWRILGSPEVPSQEGRGLVASLRACLPGRSLHSGLGGSFPLSVVRREAGQYI